MKRNRKRRKNNSCFFPVMWFSIPLLGAIFGIIHLMLGTTCDSLSRKIKELEYTHDKLVEQSLMEENSWNTMISPFEIDRALNRHGLNMSLAQRDQVVRLQRTEVLGVYHAQTQYADRR